MIQTDRDIAISQVSYSYLERERKKENAEKNSLNVEIKARKRSSLEIFLRAEKKV